MSTGFGVLAEAEVAGSRVELVGGDSDPLEVEVENIGFLALGGDTKVKLLPDGFTTENLPVSSASLFTIANRRGLFAAAGPSSFVIGTTASLREAFTKEGEYTPQLSVPSPTNISHVVFNADESHLILGASQGGVAIYSIDALSGGGDMKATFEIGTDGQALREIKPNPVSPNLIGVVTANGEARILNLENRAYVTNKDGNVVLKQGVGTMNWSKLGKQLVCGLGDGTGYQMTPDGTCKCVIPAPPQLQDHFVSTIIWLENTLFLTAHTPVPSESSDDQSTFHMLQRQQNGVNFTYTKIADPSPPFGFDGRKPSNFFHVQLRDYEPNLSDLVMLLGTSTLDLGLVGRFKTTAGKERQMKENTFGTVIPVEDYRRASMPLSTSLNETSPIGMGLDLSSKENVKRPVGGEEIEESPGPLPIIMILNHEGMLSAWNVIYNDAIEQGKNYPGMMIYAPEQPTPQSVQSPAPSMGGTPSAFSSPAAATPMAAPAFGKSSFGQSPAIGSGSPFGQPSKLGGSAFGQPSALGINTSTPAFGSSTPFGSSAFGQPSGLGGNTSAPAFGNSSFGASQASAAPAPAPAPAPAVTAFGTATTLGGGSAPAFGKPAFGTPSTLGNNATPAFGKASQLGGASFGQTSAFGTPAATSGAAPFGSSATSSGFGAYANKGGFAAVASVSSPQQGASVFGSGSAFGSSSGPSPFAPKSDVLASPFAPKPNNGSSPFAPRPESGVSPFAAKPDGPSPFAPKADNAPSPSPFSPSTGTPLSPFTAKPKGATSPFAPKPEEAKSALDATSGSVFGAKPGSTPSPFASSSGSPFGNGGALGIKSTGSVFGGGNSFAKSAESKPAESSFGKADAFGTPSKPSGGSFFGATFGQALDSPPAAAATPQAPRLPSSPDNTPPESPASVEEAPLPPDFSSLSVEPKPKTPEAAPEEAPLPPNFSSLSVVPESELPSLPAQGGDDEEDGDLDDEEPEVVEAETEDGGEDIDDEPELESDADDEGEDEVEETPSKPSTTFTFTPKPKETTPSGKTTSNIFGSDTSFSGTIGTEGVQESSPFASFMKKPIEDSEDEEDEDEDENDEDEGELEVASRRSTKSPLKPAQQPKMRGSMFNKSRAGSSQPSKFAIDQKGDAAFENMLREGGVGPIPKKSPPIKQEEKSPSPSLFDKPTGNSALPPSFGGLKVEEKKPEGSFFSKPIVAAATQDEKKPEVSLLGKAAPAPAPSGLFSAKPEQSAPSSLFNNGPPTPSSLLSQGSPATSGISATSGIFGKPAGGVSSLLSKPQQPRPELQSAPSFGQGAPSFGRRTPIPQTPRTPIPQTPRTPIPQTPGEDDTKSVVDFEREYADHEDEKIREQLIRGDVKPVDSLPPIKKMVDVDVPNDFNDVFDSIYQSGNIMVNNLGMVARNFKAYHLGQRVPAEGVKHETAKDMQPADNWRLCEMGLIGKVSGELLVKAKKITGETPALEEKHQIAAKGFIKLDSKESEIKRLLAVYNDPSAAARSRARLLAPEQQLQQRKLRKSFARVERQLKETEHNATILKAKIAQRDRHKASAKVQPPTAEAVRSTIMKLTSMAEKKRNDVDYLEEKLRRIRIKSGSRSMSLTPGRFDTPSRFNSPGRFGTPERDLTRTSITPDRSRVYGLVAPTPVMAVMEEGDVEEVRDEHRRRRAISKKVRGALERKGTTTIA